MARVENHASYDTLLGKLQRGRGAGYLELGTVPKKRAQEHLVDCITNDPRLDCQVESRSDYYSPLAIEFDLDLSPLGRHLKQNDDVDQRGWNTPLTIQTLGELAKRRFKNAGEILLHYISFGEWWDHPDENEREMAVAIFETHATREDVPQLCAATRESMEDDNSNGYRLCSLVDAFQHLQRLGTVPELTLVFEKFRYSYGRGRAAMAIAATSPEYFQKSIAEECLWDCESETRRLGLAHVALDETRVKSRVHELSNSPFEDKSVRAAAAGRIIPTP